MVMMMTVQHHHDLTFFCSGLALSCCIMTERWWALRGRMKKVGKKGDSGEDFSSKRLLQLIFLYTGTHLYLS